MIIRLKGVQTVIDNLRKADKRFANGVAAGLKEAGRYLLTKSRSYVPVHTGNLKGSAFIRSRGTGFKTIVAVGYTAAYAPFVHENVDALHGKEFNEAYADKIAAHARVSRKTGKLSWPKKTMWFPRGENQQAKFLEKPMKEERRTILGIISRRAKSA